MAQTHHTGQQKQMQVADMENILQPGEEESVKVVKRQLRIATTNFRAAKPLMKDARTHIDMAIAILDSTLAMGHPMTMSSTSTPEPAIASDKKWTEVINAAKQQARIAMIYCKEAGPELKDARAHIRKAVARLDSVIATVQPMDTRPTNSPDSEAAPDEIWYADDLATAILSTFELTAAMNPDLWSVEDMVLLEAWAQKEQAIARPNAERTAIEAKIAELCGQDYDLAEQLQTEAREKRAYAVSTQNGKVVLYAPRDDKKPFSNAVSKAARKAAKMKRRKKQQDSTARILLALHEERSATPGPDDRAPKSAALERLTVKQRKRQRQKMGKFNLQKYLEWRQGPGRC